MNTIFLSTKTSPYVVVVIGRWLFISVTAFASIQIHIWRFSIKYPLPSDVSSIFNEIQYTGLFKVITGRWLFRFGLELANGMIRHIKAIISI